MIKTNETKVGQRNKTKQEVHLIGVCAFIYIGSGVGAHNSKHRTSKQASTHQVADVMRHASGELRSAMT